MASPLVGSRAGPCPRCGSAEIYLRTDGAPQCKDCKWTGPPQYDSKFLQSWSTVHLPPTSFLPDVERPKMDPILRRAGGLLIAATIAHVVAILVVLYLFQQFVRVLGYHYFAWDTLLGLPVGIVGVIAQIIFAVIAGAGAVILLGGYDGGGPVFGTVGLVAVAFSLLVWGGPVGAVGGALLAGAGAVLRPSVRRQIETVLPA